MRHGRSSWLVTTQWQTNYKGEKMFIQLKQYKKDEKRLINLHNVEAITCDDNGTGVAIRFTSGHKGHFPYTYGELVEIITNVTACYTGED